MATDIPRPAESGPSEFRQTVNDVLTNSGITMLGDMRNNTVHSYHNSTIHNGQAATIQEEFERCREALLVRDPYLDKKALIAAKGKRAEGTCEWILEDPRYRSWLAKRFPVLRISGGPGKGKTMLSLFLTEKLAERCDRENEHLLFFYCRFQDEKFNNRQNVLRNIIYQLLEFSQVDCQQVKQVLKDFESTKKTNDILSHFEGLWDILKALLSQPHLPTVWCIIDGIDECQSSEMLEESFHEYYRRCGRPKGEPKFQVLILGRHNDEYDASQVIKLDVDQEKPRNNDTEPLGQSPTLGPDADGSGAPRVIQLEKDHKKRIETDIDYFITSSLKPLERIPGFVHIRDDVTETLFEKAEGTFLWVSFVIAELRKNKTCTEIKDTVTSFPRGLNPTFARMLSGIKSQYRQASVSILTWVIFAERPLTLEELAAATAETARVRHMAAFTADIVQHLSPLLQVQEGKVFFVHQSAKEYLMTKEFVSESPLGDHQFVPDECHGMIAHRCLEILKIGYYPDWRTAGYTSPIDDTLPSLVVYAMNYWDHHTRLSATDPNDRTRPFFENMVLQEQPIFLKYGPTHLPLHEASRFGIVRMLEALHGGANGRWRKYINHSIHYKTPLVWAINGGGDENAVKFLLEHGANSANWMRKALVEASERGQVSTIRLLLEHGATGRYNIQGKVLCWLWDQIPTLYLLGEHSEMGRWFNARHKRCELRDDTLLAELAGHGHEEIVKLVLEHGADVKTKNTALFNAAIRGHEDVLRLLLDQGAEIEARDERGRTVLSAVSSRKFYEYYQMVSYDHIVEYLVERGADIEATDPHGATPLISAVWNRNTGVARYLIDHGANVNARDLSGETALIKAILRGNEEILEHLLRRGASKHGIEQSKRPLVLSASELCSKRMLTFLLQEGADINEKTPNGLTPLTSALVRCGHSRAIAKGLLFRRPLSLPEGWRAPGLFLNHYYDEDHFIEDHFIEPEPLEENEMVKSLLNHGADTKRYGRVYLYERFLKTGTENRGIGGGWKALDAPPIVCAAGCGLDWAINLLLERDADCNARATELYLPKRKRGHLVPSLGEHIRNHPELWAAFGYTSPLPKGVRTRKAGSALLYASMGGHLSTVRLLLSRGADTSIEDGYGMTALIWATEKGFTAIEEALKEHEGSST